MNPKARAWDLGYTTGWRLVRALPRRWAMRLFDLAARDSGPLRLRRNLARVLHRHTAGRSAHAATGVDRRSHRRRLAREHAHSIPPH